MLVFFRTSYYLMASIAFATLVNDVLVLRWHNWERHLFNFLPFGEIVGWFEVCLFSALAAVSFLYALQEFLKVVG